jgi:hypothetical protein
MYEYSRLESVINQTKQKKEEPIEQQSPISNINSSDTKVEQQKEQSPSHKET